MDADASRVGRVSPGGHELSREFIARHQRERIVRALAEAVGEQGYQAVTVADIVKQARIARNTFYDNFSSKEDCFLAGFDLATEETMRRVREASEAAGENFADRTRAGIAAFLGYVAQEPALAKLCIVDVLSAGPAAMDRFEAAIQSFVPPLRPGRKLGSTGAALPETLEETLLGGLVWIVYQRLAAGEAAKVESLQAELVEFSLTPYLGAEAAREAAAASSKAAS